MEGELSRARNNVAKAEELLNTRERMLSPTVGLSQMYRSPDTTALVGSLRAHVRQLTSQRDKLAAELDALQRSTRCGRGMGRGGGRWAQAGGHYGGTRGWLAKGI